MIDVKHLSKSFGDHLVLDDISEHIYPGEKVVIIGPSGSGKSTFLRCLNLLETPTKGTITFRGHRDSPTPRWTSTRSASQMGMVFQHFNLFPNMTIRKNITLAPVRTKLMSQARGGRRPPPLCCGGWAWRRRPTPIPTSSPAARSSASPSSGPWP